MSGLFMTSTLVVDGASLNDSGPSRVAGTAPHRPASGAAGSVKGDDRPARSAATSPYSSVMAARITETEFLKRAEQRFGDQFDYSEMRWRSYKSPVKIRCRRHPGQLICITPEKHLQTLGGCRHCLRERRIATLERELNRKAAPERSESLALQPQAVRLTR